MNFGNVEPTTCADASWNLHLSSSSILSLSYPIFSGLPNPLPTLYRYKCLSPLQPCITPIDINNFPTPHMKHPPTVSSSSSSHRISPSPDIRAARHRIKPHFQNKPLTSPLFYFLFPTIVLLLMLSRLTFAKFCELTCICIHNV
jgi:hypothetical protein